jgi:hypothetical protein
MAINLSSYDLLAMETDIGEQVLALPSREQMVHNVAIGTTGSRDISHTIRELAGLFGQTMGIVSKFGERSTFRDNLWTSDYQSELALRIPSHDLLNKHAILSAHATRLENDRGDLDGIILCYSHFRNDLLQIPYIASGERRFVVKQQPEEALDYLEAVGKGRISLEWDNHLDSFSSDETFALGQLVKNSRQAIAAMRERVYRDVKVTALDFPISNEPVAENTGFLTLQVSDKAYGIAPDRIAHVVHNKTNMGSGVGFQLIDRILSLRQGYMYVTSRTPTGETYTYDTATRTLRPAPKGLELATHGTVFTLYMKRLS